MARQKKEKSKKKVTLFDLWGSGQLSLKDFESRIKERNHDKAERNAIGKMGTVQNKG